MQQAMSRLLLLGLLLGLLPGLVGCPGRPTPASQAAVTSVRVETDAGRLLLAGLTASDTVLQQEAATLLLALPYDTLMAHPVLGDRLGQGLLEQLKSDATSLATAQWLITNMKGSSFWTGLEPEVRKEALAWTAQRVEDPVMERREVAAFAILSLGSPEQLADLVPYIADEERTVRAIVAEAFGRWGTGVEWPTIRRFADDPNEYVRLRAAKALAHWTVRLGPDLDREKRDAVLAKLETDDDPFVRRMVAQIRGIDVMFDHDLYRATIYTPLLRGAGPPQEEEAWEAFRHTALGEFAWSVGVDLPVPQGIADLVMQFLWDSHPDLRISILDAIQRMPQGGDTGFYATAWGSGEPALRKKVLELLLESLAADGVLGSGADDIVRDITSADWVEMDPVLRDLSIRLVLLLARSKSLSAYDDTEVRGWERKLGDLYYSPRESVRYLVHQLNPAHPWLRRAATGRFQSDERLRKALPRLARMVWYGEDPRTIDPANGATTDAPTYLLLADDWEQLWRWGVAPPTALMNDVVSSNAEVSLETLRAAAIVLRGEVPVAPLSPRRGSAGEDWVDPQKPPTEPDESLRLT